MPKKLITQKEIAFTLRKEGFSYNEIASRLQIAKSTLSSWFRNNADLSYIKEQNIAQNREDAKESLIKHIEERRKLIAIQEKDIESEAQVSYETHKNDALFIAGIMMYAGKGDKKSRGYIRVSSKDFRIHRVFIHFCTQYLGYSKEQIRLSILAYNDVDARMVETFWKDKLHIANFYKTHLLPQTGKRRLQFGVAMTIINDTRAKIMLLQWIKLFLDENAAIV